MKTKFTLFTALVLGVLSLSAQQPTNGGFNTWTNATNPDGWATVDGIFGSPIGFSVQDNTDKVEGTSSLQLKSDSLQALPQAGVIPGIASLGTATYSPGGAPEFFGMPFTFKPDTIFFAYKYSTPGTDTGALNINLTSAGTSVFGGVLGLDLVPTAGQWASVYAPLTANYTSGSTPDTLLIQFYSSAGQVATKGSVLHIDAVRLGYKQQQTSIDEATATVTAAIYPNPAANVININSIQDLTGTNLNVYNLQGQLVLSAELHSQFNTINTSSLNNGAYIYHIVGTANKSLTQGRFIIAK